PAVAGPRPFPGSGRVGQGEDVHVGDPGAVALALDPELHPLAEGELAQPRAPERLRGHVVLDAGVGEHDRRTGLGVEALHGALQHHASSVDPVSGRSISRSRNRRAVTSDGSRRPATRRRSSTVSTSRARPGSATRTGAGTGRRGSGGWGPEGGGPSRDRSWARRTTGRARRARWCRRRRGWGPPPPAPRPPPAPVPDRPPTPAAGRPPPPATATRWPHRPAPPPRHP